MTIAELVPIRFVISEDAHTLKPAMIRARFCLLLDSVKLYTEQRMS